MKKMNSILKAMLGVTFVSSIFLVGSCGNAQPEDTKEVAEEQNDAKFDNDQREEDAEFLVMAAEINLMEIELGQLAIKKGTTTHVKDLGKMMVADHTKAQKDLVKLANDKGITIPTAPTDDTKDAYTKLDKKTGNDFDKAYADMMVTGHKDAIDAHKKGAEESNDIAISNWATGRLPGLQKHLDHSIECQKVCEKKQS